MKLNISWKVYARLFVLGLFGAITASPYLFFILQHNQRLRVTWFEVVFNQTAQTFITLVPVLLIGLMLARRIGFRLPFLENWQKNKSKLLSYLKLAILTGIFLTIYIIASNYILFQLGIRPEANLGAAPPLWQRLLASFYIGINEEIIFRLFATSFMIWLIAKIRMQKNYKSNFNIWFGLILSALIFSFASFSFPSGLAQLNYSLIFRSIVLNFIPGVVYGFYYWQNGFEAAIFTHFFVSLFLQIF